MTRPLEVAAPRTEHAAGSPVFTSRICVLIVTWNRRETLAKVLQSIARQTYTPGLIDVVIVDNAGTDGTLDDLCARFNPERVVDNDTNRAHEPKFQSPRRRSWSAGGNDTPNTLGLGSISVVRNRENMGGCGGFNTGFAFTEHWFGKPGLGGPDFVWLVDDDADVASDTLEQLHRAMETDPKIGLVGSRTVDIAEPTRTIETTIYFNPLTGGMQDDAPREHAQYDAHQRWIAVSGGTRGTGPFTGLMDVDVVSACSILARWSAVLGTPQRKGVGFWDARYFIYCDDADWCLRFRQAGWRVVLNLDAVVYHTPWNLKLTPARIYYANRNRIWMAHKVLPENLLRPVTWQTLRSLLTDARHAAFCRRAFHSRIILQTALDVVKGVSGKTGSDGPAPEGVVEAFESVGALSPDKTVVVMCFGPESPKHLDALRKHLEQHAPGRVPRLLPIVRNTVLDAPPGAIVYGGRVASRLKRQLWVIPRCAVAAVVFDQANDFPVLLGVGYNIHIDTRRPTLAQVERDGWAVRFRFMGAWVRAWVACRRYAAGIKPYKSESRYG